ncbi:gliding motility-associated C-terminal domain-containing protein [Larkinella soli]|uniref:gliding motility-associated C-terminal domain-containing protein n=1 Tax=Larkinella soli TaxID=1770527 RepID=UPI000FFB2E8C|nr:gliding motility-associated C-terminal domain-containing protein [Larkinella soli]
MPDCFLHTAPWRRIKARLRPTAALLLLHLVTIGSVRAQSCSGVLGPAVLNETFGAGPTGPLAAGKTTYDYRSRSCLDDGEYTVADTVEGSCHGTAWHEAPEDHTPGDTRGNMLVVNASYQPGEFYSQLVSGLCVGTTYEFSFWVLNVNLIRPPGACGLLVPRDPIIAMRIETAAGVVVQSVSTGSIPRTTGPTWVRCSMLFTVPPERDVILLKLINEGLGGCGNDLAIDDIQFRPCNPTLTIAFAETTADHLQVCEGGPAVIRSTLGEGYVNPAYQWQVSDDAVNWKAVPGQNGLELKLEADFPDKKYYRLLCTQAPNFGSIGNTPCRATSNTLSVSTQDCARFKISIPDVFTPNQDGTNDQLDVYCKDFISFRLTIYNRWGSVIFASDHPDKRWDGTYLGLPCMEGVYLWVVRFEYAEGSRPARTIVNRGRVLLVR